ncbi:Deoxycytidylate deaminase [Alteracholeplasma palmae J233]|uniref:Deoxycytidylate deaminase n=1 Tax=Alteracholeplasma palmae (strain ATCC 49389 / J233) TaxID=1318466 RepID=U4KQE7_ALTPJ|nr:dCMP deaminase family protein [Alteracholeplasma palmae]CCV64540.1 Deoxycytidylate deaminase [Alteracholeplasma palmae J233]
MKRQKYISWDEYFIGVAQLSALRSKDPSTQVGACIVNTDKRIIGIGYNGLPSGCEDDEFPWERENKSIVDTKYPYVVHAEANAILNATRETKGSSIYVTLFPCNECMKLIIQSGIKEIVYVSDKYSETDLHKAAFKMMKAANISYRQINASEVVKND